MSMSPEMMRYLQQLNNYLHNQNQQIQQMNTMIQKLVREVDRLNQKKSESPVIRNEYRFDLFKVERLEGTLNIGIRPDGKWADSSIDEFAVGQSVDTPSLFEKQHPDLSQTIHKEIDDYLDQDAYRTLQQLEGQFQYPLDDPYRKFIVQDVKKQIEKRISHYLNQNNTEEMTSENAAQLQQEVIEKIKQDIEKTFESFIKNLPKKEMHD